jgi:hypothetical protein
MPLNISQMIFQEEWKRYIKEEFNANVFEFFKTPFLAVLGDDLY